MYNFLTFSSIAAVCATDLGYNHQTDQHFGPGSLLVPSTANNNFGSTSNFVPSFDSANEHLSIAHQGGYENEFFTYSANEDDFNEPAASNHFENSIKQHLRVIFIKGPENSGLENTAANIIKHANEQRTTIYVLQKQVDASNLNAVTQSINHKPEVHFVKYRTPEDAANAQKAIQAQYDSLNGSSQSHNGGVAPALNFATSASAPINSQNFGALDSAVNYEFDTSASSKTQFTTAVDALDNTYASV